jgi:hypothetical protein
MPGTIAGIFKPLWSPGIDAKASIPPAYAWRGRYDNPIPTRCLAPIDFLKIPAPEYIPLGIRFSATKRVKKSAMWVGLGPVTTHM